MKTILLILFLFISNIQASTHFLRDAEKEFDYGNYSQARDYWQKHIEAYGPSSEILFNIGNSYYREKKIGLSMAYYLAAKYYHPSAPHIKANIESLQKNLNYKLQDKDETFKGYIEKTLLKNSYPFYIIISSLLLTIGLISFILRKKYKIFIFLFDYLCLCASFFILLIAIYTQQIRPQYGAITSLEAKVYATPQENALLLIQLPEGFPITYLHENEHWYLIELPQGKKGWVLKSEAYIYQPRSL